MKLLNGREIVVFMKERQLHEARSLKQSVGTTPKLAIVRTNPSPVIDMYMKLKKAYGEDIGVLVDVYAVTQDEASDCIRTLNADPEVHGIIVQLPLADPSQTDEILDIVAPAKDVDGLGKNAVLDPATPTAINWLLAGYNVELKGKSIVIVGQGRLVGEPLTRMWQKSGLDVRGADINTKDLEAMLREADVIVTATGQPGLITEGMIKHEAVVVDAGVAVDRNGLVGDLTANVRLRQDLTITPEKGGVGPLTITALFQNVLIAARQQSAN